VTGEIEDSEALRYDSAPERRELIMDLVREKGYYALTDLGRVFGVSEMTVRRDVAKLAEQGLVRVVHGGVSAVTDLFAPVEFRFRSHQHTAAKRAIADHALTLLRPGSVVGLDAGTTVLEVARRLPGDRNLTVVTHSLPVMGLCAHRQGVQLMGIGGVFLPQVQAFSGSLALRSLAQLRIQTLVMGAAAIRDGSIRSTNSFEAEMKQAFMAAADTTVVLADSSKFEYWTLMMVAELSQVSVLVTDDQISAAARAEVARSGVQLVVVPSGPGPREAGASGTPEDGDEPGGISRLPRTERRER
jgi:DeoR/GlpR family transcriptional regulator of sugar metabolism